MAFERVNETDNKESEVDRKAEAQEKIEKYNDQIDNTVKEHGEMLKNRSDLSPDEKNELQAELTENAKKEKQEFRDYMEKEYPELKEGDSSNMSEKEMKEKQDEIGDEL